MISNFFEREVCTRTVLPGEGSAAHDAFTFTASDGYHSSAAATIHFSVTASGNAAPITENSLISVDESGTVSLTSSHFPFFDADGDAFSHLTILSLPAGGSLTYWGYDVTAGQTISAYDLDWGALQLSLLPSSSGNAAASFSFSVSDGIASSAAAVLAATLAGNENSRPLTWTAQLSAASGEIAFFGPNTFPFDDPDDDTLAHVTIHAVPSGATIVDATGAPLGLPAVITAAMLQAGEVGFLSNGQPQTEFGVVFSVSDGQLDSSHSLLTVSLVAPTDLPPEEPPLRIDLNRLGGPLVVLADGYTPTIDSPPSAEIVAGWLAGDQAAGSVTFGEGDQWVYTETFDLGPAFGFSESVSFSFVATGTGETLHSYSLSVNGIHDESAGDPQPGEGDNPSDPPENDLPQLPEITPTGTLTDAVNGLRHGTLSVDDFPPIRVVEHNGKLYSLDNRRLSAFKAAQLDDIPIQRLDLDDPAVKAEFLKKFNPINDGLNNVVVPKMGRADARNILREFGKYGPN